MRIPLLVSVAATLFAMAGVAFEEAPAGKTDPASVRILIDQLGSDDYRTREKATEGLKKLDAVPDALRTAANSPDPEVAGRARIAIDGIDVRTEERAVRAMLADLDKIELDRFMKQMAAADTPPTPEQWAVVRKLSKVLTARANKLGGRKYGVPDLDPRALRVPRPAKDDFYVDELVLVTPTRQRIRVASGCVVVSGVSLPRASRFSGSVVVVDGDLTDVEGVVQNSLLLVRGNIGGLTMVRDSVILATGDIGRIGSSRGSFYQVANKGLHFGETQDDVFVKSLPVPPLPKHNSRTIDPDAGLLQLVKLGAKRNAAPE